MSTPPPEKTMTEIHIVGTAHVSQKSIDEVREAVDTINPDVIAIELDPGRFAALKQQMKEAKDAADGTAPTPESDLPKSAASGSFSSTVISGLRLPGSGAG